MMLIMQIFVVLGLGIVIYAIFEVFKPSGTGSPKKKKNHDHSESSEDLGREQKIQRLQSQVAKLEAQLEEAKAVSSGEKSGSVADQEKEAGFSAELKRREEWVAKAELELAKIKAENLDLNNKFVAKENELQEEFTKNVNLTREIREIKSSLETKEMACRLKEDQLQAQKHQIESQLKSIEEYSSRIAEFSQKEKISEWVPKLEFNQLNEEYTKLEKELEVSQEKIKNYAAEIIHLRQTMDKRIFPEQEVKTPEVPLTESVPVEPVLEEIKPETTALQETGPKELMPQENNPAEEKPKGQEEKK
jgi:chromosome segregation ATPase